MSRQSTGCDFNRCGIGQCPDQSCGECVGNEIDKRLAATPRRSTGPPREIEPAEPSKVKRAVEAGTRCTGAAVPACRREFCQSAGQKRRIATGVSSLGSGTGAKSPRTGRDSIQRRKNPRIAESIRKSVSPAGSPTTLVPGLGPTRLLRNIHAAGFFPLALSGGPEGRAFPWIFENHGSLFRATQLRL